MAIKGIDSELSPVAFTIANGALAMGKEVHMFFTFWGINILRKSGPVVAKKNLIEKMFGIIKYKSFIIRWIRSIIYS